MIEKLLDNLRARDSVNAEEEAALRDAMAETDTCPTDKVVIRQGLDLHASTLLLDGLMARYKDLRDGQRQITALHVPGDFVDLHSFTLKRLDHAVVALTPCRFARVPHVRLAAITDRFPHLARLLWLLTNIDASMHREWTVSLGRRPAIARMAHLFCELNLRLAVVGLASDNRYTLRLTQAELAECLGLTSVHVNRVLKELRGRGLIAFEKGAVTIRDLPALEQVGEFDPDYLYLERRPR